MLIDNTDYNEDTYEDRGQSVSRHADPLDG